MKSVNEFEARLLRILRCLMGHVPVEQVLTLFVKTINRPRCLSRDCVELAMDRISKGVTEWLARSGWQQDHFLVDEDTVTSGRVWGRHATEHLGLKFSANSMEWLLWLTAENFVDPKKKPIINGERLTLGDRLLFFMTFAAVQKTQADSMLLQQSVLKSHGLVWLMFPDRIAEHKITGEPDINFWFHKDHVWVLEALQTRLVNSWTKMESDKRNLSDHEYVRCAGERQAQILTAFLDAAEQTGRRDLARFLLLTGRSLIHQAGGVTSWFQRLDVKTLRMADRAAVYQAALAVFHSLGRLHEWNEQARAVGFYDEGYQGSQLWKSDWEQFSADETCQWARRLIQEVDPVKAVTSSDSSH